MNIEHIYQNIEGWFDFESTYKDMVENAKDGDHFVEIGAWLGKSTSYMAVEIANSNKKIKFDAVDTWEGSPDEEGHQEFIRNLGMSLYKKFIINMMPVLDYVNPVRGLSEDVSKLYKDDSLDFVFLDASHDYESVKKDIECWFPKVKPGGVIAGHDYNDVGTPGVEWVGVVKAVNEKFGNDKIEVRKVHAGTWIYKKPKEHIYQDISGWFDFEDIYSEMVNKYDNALFVELGAAWGKSSSYMAVEIAKSKKNIRFDVVDKWEDENGSFFDIYMKNIEPVKQYINPVKGYTTEVVNNYEDNSIDFLFIDASHNYEDVLKDIKLWYHKVKHDGIIAGHDYNIGDFPGVFQAVNDYFGRENIRISKWSWIYQKQIDHNTIPIHGRGGFVPSMNHIKENNIENPVIVEIGTQREFNNTGDGCSTTVFSWFVNTHGGKLYSIDIENSYIEQGKSELKNRGLLTDRVNLICQDGIKFFDDFSGKIDLLYLDAWDYRGTDDDKRISEEKHLEAFLKAEKFLSDNALILIDDIADQETYVGKGHLVIPYLLKNGYKLILKEWQFLFSKKDKKTIPYLAGGLLGDFIDQLSIIKEIYLSSGKKGDLYLVDNNTPPSYFPSDWKGKPCMQLDWRFGIEKAYEDLKDVVLKQDYISSFQIYKSEPLNSPIHLSSWRKSPLLYNASFYEIFKNEYDVEWASHKWLDLPTNDEYKDTILISASVRRFDSNYNYNDLKKYNKKILFAATDIDEYNKFKELTGCDFELKLFDNLIDYWIAINSCYLFVTNASSFFSIAQALYKNTIILLPNNEEDVHFMMNVPNSLWYSSDTKKQSKIMVMSCCFNEEKILPFYLDYYTNFIKVDKIVIYDGGSTDKSQDIIKQYPNVDLILDPQEKLDDRHLNDIRNDGWKPYRDQYDWIIVCDMDEFIYHPNLKDKLLEYDREGITIPLTDGYDMIDKKFPKFEKGKFIHNVVTKGILDNVFLNKKSIFKSSVDINYHIGSHSCEPSGPVKYAPINDIKHLHFKWLSNKYLKRRSAGVADRLSDWNLSGGCGSHNRPFSLTSIEDFNRRYDSAIQIFEENKTIPIYAFSHNYLINNWEEILVEQLISLRNSGLYDELTTLFMYVYGDDDSVNRFYDMINSYDELFRITVVRIENNFFEYPTLQALQEFAKIENAHILYFHLKGIWSVNNGGNPDAIRSWRKCLEYFNIEKWRNCVSKLNEGYEVVGALYNYNPVEPLFSGNFWWTTTDYLRKLPKLEYIKENDPDPDDVAKTWCRAECEKWINKIPSKFYNFFVPKDFGFYFIPIEEFEYRKDNLEKYKLSVIIPTYNRKDALKECIESIVKQNYNNIEILVCHDGPSEEYMKFRAENNHYRDVKFYWMSERRNNYGANQRNEMLRMASGDFILHIDDDNILYDNYLKIMTEQLDDQTGMVVCRIHFNDKEWHNYVLPLEDKLQPCFIDQLGILFKAEIGKMFMWDDYFGHDHRYISACERVINERGLKIKYLPNILASHRFLGNIIPRTTIIHHCYLRYSWKEILEEQIHLMKDSGLYDACSEIFATAYADEENNMIEFKKVIEREDTLGKWHIIELKSNNYEFDALKFLREYCENKHANICYFHLKGVISNEITPNIGIPTWRNYLNYFTINKWKENIERLKMNDVVCVDWNFNDMHQRYVMGGHFFWTKSEYVRTLPQPMNDENRYLSEIWITSVPKVKVYENFNAKEVGYDNLYLQLFPPSAYITKKILVFHHSYLINRWKEIVTDQIKLMKESGLYDNANNIYLSYYGDTEEVRKDFINHTKSLDVSNKFLYHKNDENLNEFGCLQLISDTCKTENAYVGYCHTKGVWSESISANIGIKTWRDYLNYFTITKWKESIDKLKEGYDMTSVNHDYNDLHRDYIVGGFLWTTSEYVRTLPYPCVTDNRFEAEIWIMKNNSKRIFEHFNSTKAGYRNLYMEVLPDYVYRDDIKKYEPNVCYIMTSHPNFKMSEDITLRSIKAIKPSHIFLSAHCPVSLDIQKEVDYVIFDKNNPLIRHDFFTVSWFPHDDYYATLNITKNNNNFNHALGVFLNYYNSLILAKSQGYNIAVCTNFDLVFSPEDKEVINERIRRMVNGRRKAFFMNTPEREGTHYKTIFFITDIDYFLNTFKYIASEDIYKEEMKKVNSNTNCLENFVYHSLKYKTDELLLEEINEGELFPTSNINLFSLIEYNTILSIENNPDHFIIWFSSANSLDNREFNLEVKKNGQVIFTDEQLISKQFIYFKKVKFERGDNFELRFRTMSNGEILRDKTIEVNNEIFGDIKSYGVFIEKKTIESI